jgi:hypothetical protein
LTLEIYSLFGHIVRFFEIFWYCDILCCTLQFHYFFIFCLIAFCCWSHRLFAF